MPNWRDRNDVRCAWLARFYEIDPIRFAAAQDEVGFTPSERSDAHGRFADVAWEAASRSSCRDRNARGSWPRGFAPPNVAQSTGELQEALESRRAEPQHESLDVTIFGMVTCFWQPHVGDHAACVRFDNVELFCSDGCRFEQTPTRQPTATAPALSHSPTLSIDTPPVGISHMRQRALTSFK